MSRTSAHSSKARRGFTLLELMISLSLLGIVITGVLSAYLFLGRNLGRMINVQQQQVQSRRALRTFTQDLSTASALSTATSTDITLSKPVAGGTATVIYTYSASDGTLIRRETVPPAPETVQTLLKGLTTFSFSYYNSGGTVVTSSPQSIKTVELVFSSAAGSANSANLVSYTSVSPRVVLRNKPILQ